MDEGNVRGFEAEYRFLSITNNHNKPTWLVRTERASPEWDAAGIDAFALVLFPGSESPERIPIQVKIRSGSRGSKRKHSGLSEAGMVFVAVLPTQTDSQIHKKFLASLTLLYEQGKHPETYLQKRERIGFDGNILGVAEDIRRQRSIFDYHKLKGWL